MTLRSRLTVMVAIIAASLTVVSAALAGSWTLTTANGTYTGECNSAPNGSLNCHGTLTTGTAEQAVINSGNCVLVLTPSGRAIMNCR